MATEAAPLSQDVMQDLDRLKEINRIGKEVKKAKAHLAKCETKCAETDAARSEAREVRNQAQRDLDGLLEDLAKLANGQFPEHLPFKGDAQPAQQQTTTASPEAWRTIRLADVWAEVGADAKLLPLLEAAKITTLGELADFTTSRRLTDIKGLGPAKAEAVENAIVAYWSAHPQQPAEAPAAESEAKKGKKRSKK